MARCTKVIVKLLKHCARCGCDHHDLRFAKLTRRHGPFTHWATCPRTKQPIMLCTTDTDDPIPEITCKDFSVAKRVRLPLTLQDVSKYLRQLVLALEQGVGEGVETIAETVDRPITVAQAREVIALAFKADPDYRRVYVDNIACVLMDNIPGLMGDKPKRAEIADKILRWILES